LLGLFDVSYAFQDCIWIVYIVWHIFVLMLSQILLWNVLEMSNELNKIWLRRLNLRISKDERLNWFKVLKWTNSKIEWKLRDKNIFNSKINYLLLLHHTTICYRKSRENVKKKFVILSSFRNVFHVFRKTFSIIYLTWGVFKNSFQKVLYVFWKGLFWNFYFEFLFVMHFRY